jgi:hypothetical protein
MVTRKLLVVLVLVLAATAAMGQETDLGQGKERVLNGHGFLPSLYVTDPWVETAFRNYAGGGVSSGLETPFYNLDGEEIFVLKADLVYASLGMGYQQNLWRTWAVGVDLSGLVRSGTNGQSLITEGANVDRTAHLWFKKRLFRKEKSQLTVGVDWTYDKTFVITPYEFAEAIIGDESLEDASLLHDVKGWTSYLIADYARAFSPTFGLRANAQIGLYEVPFTSGVAKATHRLGLLFEMDLNPRYGKPVGLTLGHTHGFPTDEPTAGLSGTLFGLWYTGKEAFVVGAETGYMKLPTVETGTKVNAMYGVFTIRYYF